MTKRLKRPNDSSQLANLIMKIATGEIEDKAPEDDKNPAAVALGRLGGLKGGMARAKKLTAEERSEIAKKAAAARWSKKQSEKETFLKPAKRRIDI